VLRTISGALLGTLLGAAFFGAALAIAALAPASAADLAPNYRYYTVPAPYYAFSWAGPYIGATAGY
jgi:opacity protein-like surface antigen